MRSDSSRNPAHSDRNAADSKRPSPIATARTRVYLPRISRIPSDFDCLTRSPATAVRASATVPHSQIGRESPKHSFSRVTSRVSDRYSRSRSVVGGFDIRTLIPDIPPESLGSDSRSPVDRLPNTARSDTHSRASRSEPPTPALPATDTGKPTPYLRQFTHATGGFPWYRRPLRVGTRPRRRETIASSGPTDSYDLADRLLQRTAAPPVHVRRDHPSIEA